MAVLSILEGDLEVQIKHLCRANTASLITDGVLTASDYPTIKGGLMEFRLIMDQVFAQFNTDLTVAGLILITGKSWRECRWQLAYNFALVDAVANP